MPAETIAAFQHHGRVEEKLETELDAAQHVFKELYAAGLDYDDIVATLEREGIEKFDAAYNEILSGIARKRQPRTPTGKEQHLRTGRKEEETVKAYGPATVAASRGPVLGKGDLGGDPSTRQVS